MRHQVKKIGLVFLLLLTFSGSAGAQEDPIKFPPLNLGPDDVGVVRGFIWGISKDDVREFETGMYFDELENAIFYLDYVFRKRTLITYEFNKGKLWRVQLSSKREYSDPKAPLDDFGELQQELSRKYGEAEVVMDWKSRKYRDYPKYWGTAMMQGSLEMSARWHDEKYNTDIVLYLKGRDFVPSLTLTYTDKAQEEAMKQIDSNGTILLPDPVKPEVNP